MDLREAKSAEWGDGDSSTMDPGVSSVEMVEEVPTLTVATVIGVALVVLVAIAMVFVLGVLLDCRQQRILENKIGQARRLKSRRINGDLENDGASIANNMEEAESSSPPAHALQNIP